MRRGRAKRRIRLRHQQDSSQQPMCDEHRLSCADDPWAVVTMAVKVTLIAAIRRFR